METQKKMIIHCKVIIKNRSIGLKEKTNCFVEHPEQRYYIGYCFSLIVR